MSDAINKILDLEPVTKDRQEIITYVPETTGTEIEEDFKFARENIYDVINSSRAALTDMIEVAKQSQHPRAYEVLNTMLKTIADINKDLIDLQKKRKEITTVVSDGPTSVHNNLFVGTTAELNKMIERAQEQALAKNT